MTARPYHGRGMSDIDDIDEFDEDGDFDDEETELDRTRTDYSGVELHDEFQPVDDVELAEAGALLDDPEHLSRHGRGTDPDDVGWDLDEGDELDAAEDDEA